MTATFTLARGIAVVAAASALGGSVTNLPTSNVQTPAGHLTALKGRVVYGASSFPIPVRIGPIAGRWQAAQWTTASRGKPVFGWVAIGGGTTPAAPPQGIVALVTAYGTTPSVAATVARLRTGGSHAPDTHVGGTMWSDVTSVTIAGYSGREFDGNVWGIYGHTFIPFSPRTHAASPADSWRVEKGESFRIVALDVRGKTVVLFFNSVVLSADEFAAFLTSAGKLLALLRFPV